MKKFVSFMLSLILSVNLLSVPALAAWDVSDPAANAEDGFTAVSAEKANYAVMSLEELAYCDLETAPAAWQDDIVAAREDIIYSKSWTVDGQCVLIAPDGTVEELPEFYDLFPADWAIPASGVDAEEIVPYSDEINYSGRFYLDKKPQTGFTPPFYLFNGRNGSLVRMKLTDIPGDTCNMGFTDLYANRDAGYVANVPVMYTFGIFTYVTRYGARASTDSDTGFASALVWEVQ